MNYLYKENNWTVEFIKTVYPSDFMVYIEDEIIGYINFSDIIDIRNKEKNISDFKVFSDIKNICGSIDFINDLILRVSVEEFGCNCIEYLILYYKLDLDEIKALNKAINEPNIQKKLNYFSDNYRYCIVGNSASEKIYYDFAKRGCCGFSEIEFEIDKNRRAKFGFNFGH